MADDFTFDEVDAMLTQEPVQAESNEISFEDFDSMVAEEPDVITMEEPELLSGEMRSYPLQVYRQGTETLPPIEEKVVKYIQSDSDEGGDDFSQNEWFQVLTEASDGKQQKKAWDALTASGLSPMAIQVAAERVVKPPSIKDTILEEGPETAGSVIGGVLGLALSGGNPYVAATTSVMGTMTANYLENKWDQYRNPLEATYGFKDTAGEMAIEGAFDLAGEGTGKVLGKIGGAVFNKRTLTTPIKGADELNTILQDLVKHTDSISQKDIDRVSELADTLRKRQTGALEIRRKLQREAASATRKSGEPVRFDVEGYLAEIEKLDRELGIDAKKIRREYDALAPEVKRAISPEYIPENVAKANVEDQAKVTPGGVALSAVQRSKSKIVKTLDKIGESTPFGWWREGGSRGASKKKLHQIPAMRQHTDNVVNDLFDLPDGPGMDLIDVGKSLDTALMWSAEIQNLNNKTMLKQAEVNLGKKGLPKRIDLSEPLGAVSKSIATEKAEGRVIDSALSTLREGIHDRVLTGEMGITEAYEYTQELRLKAHKLRQTGDLKAARYADHVADDIRRRVDDVLQPTGISMDSLMSSKDMYDSAVIRNIAEAVQGDEPQKAVTLLFGDQNPEAVRIVRDSLLHEQSAMTPELKEHNKNLWKRLQREYINGVLRTSTVETGDFAQAKSAKALTAIFGDKASRENKRFLKEMFPDVADMVDGKPVYVNSVGEEVAKGTKGAKPKMIPDPRIEAMNDLANAWDILQVEGSKTSSKVGASVLGSMATALSYAVGAGSAVSTGLGSLVSVEGLNYLMHTRPGARLMSSAITELKTIGKIRPATASKIINRSLEARQEYGKQLEQWDNTSEEYKDSRRKRDRQLEIDKLRFERQQEIRESLGYRRQPQEGVYPTEPQTSLPKLSSAGSTEEAINLYGQMPRGTQYIDPYGNMRRTV
jgi:hypothetical protein